MDADQQGSTTQLAGAPERAGGLASHPAESAPISQVRAQLLLAEDHFRCHTIAAGATRFRILPSGCIYSIERAGIQVNQVLASPTAGGIARIYLRDLNGGEITSFPIVGPGSTGTAQPSARGFNWSGDAGGIRYDCELTLHDDGLLWLINIRLLNTSSQPRRVDCVQLQDIGLAARSQVRNNELYNSQYLDHAAYVHDRCGWVVMSRQNLPQAQGTHPWLMQGCLPSATGFCTDGADFFGVGYRAPAAPAALSRAVIGSRVRQHETSYTAIQSTDQLIAPGAAAVVTFFARFSPDHLDPSSTDDLSLVTEIQRVASATVAQKPVEPVAEAQRDGSAAAAAAAFANVFASDRAYDAQPLGRADVERLFPLPRRHEELDGSTLLSFFHTGAARHVVMKAKETAVQRPHGHIVRAGTGCTPGSPVVSAACYAAGVFASQITFGNTVLAKYTSGTRDPLNIVRSSGLRIFVRDSSAEAWQLLAVPSAFEMSTEGCRWIYSNPGNEIVVSLAAATDAARIDYTITAAKPVRLLISAEIAASPNEYDHAATLTIDSTRGSLTVHASAESLFGARQPGASLSIAAHRPQDVSALGGDELLFDDGRPRGLPYAVLQTRELSHFALSVAGHDSGTLSKPPAARPRQPDRANPGTTVEAMVRGLELRTPNAPHASTLQDTLRWFARDALVHLSIPRGLEQANGGAWGVRDVCQGPIELLLSYGHHDIASDVLLKLFSQQYARRRDWPQWFMFAPYAEIQSTHCHGDVLIWPLKALCDYLEETNDGDLLHKRVAYTDDTTFEPTEAHETILQHVDRVIEKMQLDFVPGVSLPKFGDGDWDDSLQPADSKLRDRMVSAWTTELMYQTLRRYAVALAHFGHDERAARVDILAGRIADDFQALLIPDGTVAGFAVFDDARGTEYLLHPRDQRTGLRYRLLPMTRGILSNIFTPAQAQQHLQLIREHLLYPDGARLMDRPTAYHGGRESVFRRAESAAFFGREIGLQYVHAHLRYAEAMAMLGRADDLLRALLVVNPIAVTDVVPNARARQRNCFFSSSDAAFVDRRHASRDYAKLRTGEVAVDGGWRIYSSGPGIYSNLVIRHLFGLRRYLDWVEFDPVLPAEFDGAECALTHNDRRVRYRFLTKLGRTGPKQVRINGITVRPTQHAANPYRPGGFRFPLNEFEAMLTLEENLVDIEM